MLFGKFGNVEDAEIIYNDKGSKGFGFVTMSRGREADNARIRLHQAVPDCTCLNLAVPSCTWPYQAEPGCTRLYH